MDRTSHIKRSLANFMTRILLVGINSYDHAMQSHIDSIKDMYHKLHL